MERYKQDFLELCIDNDILMFGEYTLKSGRISPYFFNVGKFNNGRLLAALATGYAELIQQVIPGAFTLYGPAYKGIPLAAATAIWLSVCHERNVPYAFNRKEAKDHGEGGSIVGAPLAGDVVMIDDVITAGTSAYESADIIRQHGARLQAIIIALDRQEVGRGETKSAVQKIEESLSVPVFSIISLHDILGFLGGRPDFHSRRQAVAQYRADYGASQ